MADYGNYSGSMPSYSGGDLSDLDSGNKKKKIIWVVSIVVVLILVLGIVYYFGGFDSLTGKDSSNNKSKTAVKSNSSVNPAKEAVADLKLNSSMTLASFVITDISFKRDQLQMLQDAVKIAKKYKITFDLALVPKPFDTSKDNETYKFYLDHRDVFEVVSHGYNHANPINSTSMKGEFSIIGSTVKSVPLAVQQGLFGNASAIFKKYGMASAEKILILPGYAGDNNTLSIANKAGYKLVVMNFPSNVSEYRYGNLIVSKSMPISALNEWDRKNSLSSYGSELVGFAGKKQGFVLLPLYSSNFVDLPALESSIADIKNKSESYTGREIVFGFISEKYK